MLHATQQTYVQTGRNKGSLKHRNHYGNKKTQIPQVHVMMLHVRQQTYVRQVEIKEVYRNHYCNKKNKQKVDSQALHKREIWSFVKWQEIFNELHGPQS